MEKVLGSPQSILWVYYNILRILILDFHNTTDENEKKEKAFLVIIVSVTIIDAFLNIYFFLLVSEEKYSYHMEQIKNEIKKTSFPLDKKVNQWPMLLFNKNVDFGSGVGQKFMNLKNLRNKLLHFQSDHNELDIQNIKISKLLDITIYEELAQYDVDSCQSIVLDLASEIFRLVGIQKDKIPHFIHSWFGDLSRIKGKNAI